MLEKVTYKERHTLGFGNDLALPAYVRHVVVIKNVTPPQPGKLRPAKKKKPPQKT
jgi:hypothetical protein